MFPPDVNHEATPLAQTLQQMVLVTEQDENTVLQVRLRGAWTAAPDSATDRPRN
jgi:hypothetical protein